MQIFVPKEYDAAELRAPITPDTAAKLVKLGAYVTVESGMGRSALHEDAAYEAAGATVAADRAAGLAAADMVLRIRKPPLDEVSLLKRGCIHISFLDPFNERPLVEALAAAGVSAISMEMIPRTTKAQKMDALSSQASLAGYVAVLIAADRLPRILPMMMTPAGTISPSRVFVIGAGVAGLQAIATAKRLGARVDAFDTRPVVEEQVKSLGAKFVKVDLGETGQTKDGYAKELTPEQQAKQREAMAAVCAQSDIVITTAQLFGRRAPVIITKEMIARMKPGSVIVDLAVETGGNVEGSVAGEEATQNGVRIVGLANLPARVSVHASQMYSSNLGGFIEDFWDKESKSFVLKRDDEIVRGCLVTHGGAVVNETIQSAYAKQTGGAA
ncbi:MAG: Re/Si-specific NAD(P)(+) transhydrogenase subunit alpha [Candidatus Hydrogenedentes bacterium]|nr:Re/Si-specific NAD(P)(+) transhydrogenase subunit alpha [Candidatus Hydrogenedentota bacterium]